MRPYSSVNIHARCLILLDTVRYLSWRHLLQDLKARGLKDDPCIAVGDRALGFWKALAEEYPRTREQQCWVHKTANVLDKLSKSQQPDSKQMIHDMYLSPTKKEALAAYQRFLDLYEAKYPKACECLRKDEEVLFTFYDFPAPHWSHLRTTNPIESTFATVRHRTRQTKGCGSRVATLSMVFKLATDAQKHWHRPTATSSSPRSSRVSHSSTARSRRQPEFVGCALLPSTTFDNTSPKSVASTSVSNTPNRSHSIVSLQVGRHRYSRRPRLGGTNYLEITLRCCVSVRSW